MKSIIQRCAVGIFLFIGGNCLAVYSGAWIDCGTWTNGQGTNVADYQHFYLTGLMDGLALGRGREFWRADGIEVSRDQVALWMDKYCRENPLNYVITGAVQLFDERTKSKFAPPTTLVPDPKK
ncbi:MAG: hypothetical protein WA190_00100 [Usitatibacter sp.]